MTLRLTCGEMKLRFSFGDKKIYSTIKISQNIMNMIVGIKFEFQPRILIFCIIFAQKVYILSKKGKTTFKFRILELVHLPNFSLN